MTQARRNSPDASSAEHRSRPPAMARAALFGCALALAPLPVAGAEPAPEGLRVPFVRLAVDRDDDDADHTPDGQQGSVRHAADLLWVDPGAAAKGPRRIEVPAGAPVRILVDGVPVAAGPEGTVLEPRRLLGSRPPTSVAGRAGPSAARRIALQATAPGRTTIHVDGAPLEVRSIGLYVIDAGGHDVDLARSHVSLLGTRPGRCSDAASDPPSSGGSTPEETSDPRVRWLLAAASADLPTMLEVESLGAAGEPVERARGLALSSTPCPEQVPTGLRCARTDAIELVATAADAAATAHERCTMRAELGGYLVARSGDLKLGSVRIGGPRGGRAGPVERLRGTVRVSLVRQGVSGPPPIGADEAVARSAMLATVQQASALWSACGIGFGPAGEQRIQIVDPPPPHLLHVGCGLGAPARGGRVSLRIQNRAVAVTIEPGTTPQQAARRIAAAIERAGFVVRVSDLPKDGPSALAGTDLSVRTSDGRLVSLAAPEDGPVCTDAALGVCIGAVELGDGLEHFGDVDAQVGTLEERTLLRAFDDGDPTTLDVVVVSGLGRGDRIGESFLGAARGAIRNTVIVDRAGLRPGRGGLTLAHELGHVLLGVPGHPDDFGIDTPTRLMDADADDVSVFGARRLTTDECAAAVLQSGPGSPAPLLSPWPIGALRPSAAPWLSGSTWRAP